MGQSDLKLSSCLPEQTCYFSISPSRTSHFSQDIPSSCSSPTILPETPSDPSNPLLALRSTHSHFSPPSWAMDASKLLQLQTAAAYGRPEAQARQKSTSSSASTDSNASTPGASASTEVVSCARCRRTSNGPSGMVSYGTNQYYCRHCADIVGYNSG